MTKKGYRQTEEHRKKNSDSKRGRVPWNKGKKGLQVAWNKGIPRTEEEKKKMSEVKLKDGHLKGIPKPPGFGEKISKILKGRKFSEEHIKHMSESRMGKHIGIDNPFFGKQHSKETKLKIGSRYYPIGKEHPNYGIPPSTLVTRGKRSYYNTPLQGTVCFRSSYEIEYAKYLDSIKEPWFYEIETFDLGDTTYTPDFYLPRLEKFIEIKGWMLSGAREKIKLFREQYPFDLEILYKEDLKKLGCGI